MSEGDLAVLAQAVNMTKLNPEIVAKKQYPRKVTEEEWKKSVSTFFEENDEYIEVVTNDEDMNKIEELLGVEKGFFSTPYVVKTKQEFCPNCNRRNNFLDVVSTGLGVHSKEFLLNVFTGKFGKIINNTANQRCLCYKCGIELPRDATKYSAPKEPTPEQLHTAKQCPTNYNYPVYKYKF